MFESYIKRYVSEFCSKVTVEQLAELIANSKDMYPFLLQEISDDEKPPGFASIFQDVIREDVKRIMAEVSPEHFRLFEANPSWAERQMDGLMDALFS